MTAAATPTPSKASAPAGRDPAPRAPKRPRQKADGATRTQAGAPSASGERRGPRQGTRPDRPRQPKQATRAAAPAKTPQPAHAPEPETPPSDRFSWDVARTEDRYVDRVGWSLLLVTAAQIFFAVLMLFGAIVGGKPPSFVFPLIMFLGLHAVGNIARAIGRGHPVGLGIEGHAKALAWFIGALGALTFMGEGFADTRGPQPWMFGTSMALGGLRLYGHHRRALRASLRLAIEEAAVGGGLSALFLPLAIGALVEGPWKLIVPGVLLVLGTALVATKVIRMRKTHEPAATRGRDAGWWAFYEEHFFRHTLIVAAVIGWVILRGELRALMPLAVAFEYALGVALIGMVFWSLRGYLMSRLSPHPLSSVHRRHEQAVERQGETGFDDIERALGAFLEEGDTEPVARLGKFLDERGLGTKDAFAPILTYRAHAINMLVHPGWLYGARVAILLFIAIGILSFADAVSGGADVGAVPDAFAFLAIGVGLFLSQWNSFGGPWVARSAIGLVGVGSLFLADRTFGELAGTGTLLGALTPPPYDLVVWLALLLPIGLHAIPRRKRRTPPRYAHIAGDPLDAIDRLKREAERALVKRGVWLAILGLILFIVLGELARVLPGIGLFMNVYLVLAIAIVAHPVLLVAGLRIGRGHVARRDERERKRRQARHEAAHKRLQEAITAVQERTRAQGFRAAAAPRPAAKTT